MRIIHTSDWHLGRRLYRQARYQEFAEFLTWLSEYIADNHVDVLLISGDIFDSNTPSNTAQNLYYDFLNTIAHSYCQHIIIISGNHDSPSFLNAPKALLKDLNIHIMAQLSKNTEGEIIFEDEIIALHNQQGVLELLVCAVPYLRDRDIRLSQLGESLDDKEDKLKAAIQAHYHQVAEIAVAQRAEYLEIHSNTAQKNIPIIAMGHLFTAGGKTQQGDGVRDLYVGSLAHLSATCFPDSIDYLALGHLHIPQRIAKSETRRYCGSPLAMSFGEAKQQKIVIELQFNTDSHQPDIQEIAIPRFQALSQIKGNLAEILHEIKILLDNDPIYISSLESSQSDRGATTKQHWLEIHYTGKSLHSDLSKQLYNAVQKTHLHILRIENKAMIAHALRATKETKTLEQLQPEQVFQRCLTANDIPASQYKQLMASFNETLANIEENNQ